MIAGAGLGAFIPFGTGTGVNSIVSTLNAVNTASLAQSTGFVGVPQSPPDQQGGGSWSRVIGGSVETSANTATTTSVRVGQFPAGTVDNCRTTTQQDFLGTQVGADIARLNFAGGGNIHLGITAGYFDITSKDRTPGEPASSSDVQVPFAGLYMAMNAGAFSFDAQVRGDYYHMELNDAFQGIFNQSLDAKTAALLWNASYQFNLSNSFYLRPSVGGVWSRTDIDQFHTSGAILLPATVSPGLSFPGTVIIDDIHTLLGRASLTAGTTMTSGNLALQPFATVSVFHEFAGAVNARMTGNIDAAFAAVGLPAPGVPNLSASSSTSRVGTYAHFGVGIAGTIIDTGWLGYAKIDFLTGDNIEAWSINAGLRHQFQPPKEAASLKDDSVRPAVSRNYNWTGLYAGTSSGGLTGEGDWLDSRGPASPRMPGYLSGGQIGYNHQSGRIVVGAEADFHLSNAKGGSDCPSATGFPSFFQSCEVGIDSMGILAGRVGFTFDRALIYAKGGWAFADVNARTRDNTGGNFVLVHPNGTVGTQRDSDSLSGWALGAGFEFAITDQWSAKAEYMHFDFGRATFQTLNDAANGIVIPADIGVKGDTVRIGVNYHFGQRGGSYVHDPPK